MRKVLIVFCITILASSLALAQGGRAGNHSTITVSMSALTCASALGTGSFPALSWSFGATQSATPITSPGGIGGKATMSNLTITKQTDGCSPTLFGYVATGRRINTVSIVQQDRQTEAVFTVTLTDVIISSFQISGETSSDFPTESIAFDFAKICTSDSQTGAKFCWDSLTNRTF